MAGRRARNAPSPPPEPVPEPEPEKVEAKFSSIKTENVVDIDEEFMNKSMPKDDFGKSKCPEKIIERIIICPGGQDTSQFCGHSQGARNFQFPPPPPPDFFLKNDKTERKRKKKSKKRDPCKKDENEMTEKEFCSKPLYPRPTQVFGSPSPNPPPQPIIICQQPVICCCQKCRSEGSGDSEEEEVEMIDTATFLSFTNMVFAAANIMSQCPDAYN